MTDRQPTETRNLDIYGNATLEWSRVIDALSCPPTADLSWFLGTVQPDGRPHAAGVGAMYLGGDMYVVSGPRTRKSRDLAANPACTLSVRMEGIDQGRPLGLLTRRHSNVRRPNTVGGWPVEVENDAFTAPYSAPSAGPPPWHLYRFVLHTVFGVGSAEPHGATRWRFS